MVQGLTPETYEKLKSAVEIGKWEDGTSLTEEQRESSLQLVLAYQALVLDSNEPFTIAGDGQMVMKSKKELREEINNNNEIARFTNDDI